MIGGKKLGEGSYGIVYDVDNSMALKRNFSEKDSSYLGAIRELNLLYLLMDHPNIIHLKMVIYGDHIDGKNFSPIIGEDRDTQRNDSVHFLFDKALYDLHDFIYEHTFDMKLYFKYMIDMLLGLEYMHYKKLIHRDLKPSNILIFPDNVAKLCDFGLSKPYTYQGDQTPGVITSLYRAPEIILSIPNYDYKCDIWSMGCIFYELISKRTFIIEKTDQDRKLLRCILDTLPVPLTKNEFKTFITDNNYKQFVVRNLEKKRKTFKEHMNLSKKWTNHFNKVASLDDFCDLLSHMIHFDDKTRYSASECLNHPFFKDNKTYIDKIRNDFNHEWAREDRIIYPICDERIWMAETAIFIFNHRDAIEWYTHRILFQAIDIFQRYLYSMYKLTDKKNIHTKSETELRFMTCIYIAIKYFSTLYYPISFASVVEDEFLTPECQKLAEQFEGGLIKNCLKYDIYHTTVYESSEEPLTEEDIMALLILFTKNDSLSNKFPHEVVDYYKKNLKNATLEQLCQNIL